MTDTLESTVLTIGRHTGLSPPFFGRVSLLVNKLCRETLQIAMLGLSFALATSPGLAYAKARFNMQ